jgi:hypothetical protein
LPFGTLRPSAPPRGASGLSVGKYEPLYGIGLTTDEYVLGDMYQLRCTAKLRPKVEQALKRQAPGPVLTTTKLGDWFANRFNVGAERYVICTSERSLLTLLVTAKELGSVGERIIDALNTLLTELQVPAPMREREIHEMREFRVTPTNSRSILGSMNDMAYLAEAEFEAVGRPIDLRKVNRRLAAVPCAPIGYEYPGERAVELLRAWV